MCEVIMGKGQMIQLRGTGSLLACAAFNLLRPMLGTGYGAVPVKE